MSNKNKESKTLNEVLDNYVNPDIMERLKNLEAFWIEPSVLAEFEKRVLTIAKENSWSEDIVVWALDKQQIQLESIQASYTREFRTIVNHAANDGDYETPQVA